MSIIDTLIKAKEFMDTEHPMIPYDIRLNFRDWNEFCDEIDMQTVISRAIYAGVDVIAGTKDYSRIRCYHNPLVELYEDVTMFTEDIEYDFYTFNLLNPSPISLNVDAFQGISHEQTLRIIKEFNNQPIQWITKKKEITYPFEFQELRIDDMVLDKLGFSEYSSGCGDYGEREFKVGDEVFAILCNDQTNDDTDGYTSWGRYRSESYGLGFRHKDVKMTPYRKIHFLHDLYECILISTHTLIEPFITKCRENLMHEFIEDYLKYKTENGIL